jgi:hypothetical protein
MVKHADGKSDDSTKDTCNHSLRDRSKSLSSTSMKEKLAKAKKTKLVPIKFEYNVSTANVNIAQLHGKVLKAISSAHGDNVTVYNKQGATEISHDKLPRSQEAWDESFHMQIVTNTRNSSAIIMVGHQLGMSISLSEMKQGIQTVLRQVDAFVKYNAHGTKIWILTLQAIPRTSTQCTITARKSSSTWKSSLEKQCQLMAMTHFTLNSKSFLPTLAITSPTRRFLPGSWRLNAEMKSQLQCYAKN